MKKMEILDRGLEKILVSCILGKPVKKLGL